MIGEILAGLPLAGSAVGNAGTSIAETVAAADQIYASVIYAAAIAETGLASDTTGRIAIYAAASEEAAAATDTVAASRIIFLAITETATATDSLAGGSLIVETGAARDSTDAVNRGSIVRRTIIVAGNRNMRRIAVAPSNRTINMR